MFHLAQKKHTILPLKHIHCIQIMPSGMYTFKGFCIIYSPDHCVECKKYSSILQYPWQLCVKEKHFPTIVEIVGTAIKAIIAKHPWLTTDAGEQADDNNSEPEVDELVGS